MRLRFRVLTMILATALLSALAVTTFCLRPAEAGKKPAPQAKKLPGSKDSIDKDYGSELPRIPSKSPQDSLKAIAAAPGFEVQLVAAEPLVRSPVSIDFDENGRMFVAEFPEYNNHLTPNFKEKGCIRVLEDRDGDGTFETSNIYVDNLDSPVAVACWDGGVFIGTVPDVLYCKDSRGDGKVDIRKKVYTGFLKDKAGEAMLNSFRWGLENRFHISTSLAGGNIQTLDGAKSPAVDVRGKGFVFEPFTHRFETMTGTGQHGMTMDDFGRKFVCGNSNPCNMIMYDSRYFARSPYADTLAPSINIVPKGAQTQLFRVSPNEPWRIVRTRLRTQGIVPGSNEGGKVSGFFTGATGVTVYRGDAFPEEYRGNVFIGEVSNNLVHRAILKPDGVGFVADRADNDREFLASTDNWHRPCQFAAGPDGCLYVLDIYRELIETVESIPPLILKHLHPESGVSMGRIHRIVPKGHKRRPTPKLGSATSAELVKLLEHPNGWHRDTASRLLYQRKDESVLPALRTLAEKSASPLGRLHALYALDGLGGLRETLVLRGLKDPVAGVRENALKLAEKFPDSAEVRSALLGMAGDPDARVRYQLAFSLGAFPGAVVNETLVAIVKKDRADPWVRMAAGSATHRRAGDLFAKLTADESIRKSGPGRQMLASIANQIGSSGETGDIANLARTIESLPASETDLGKSLLKSAYTKMPAAARAKLQNAGRSKEYVAELLASAKATAGDEKKSVADRTAALRVLGLAEFSQSRGVLAECLKFRQPEEVQRTAIETLAKFEGPAAADLVLAAWPTLSPKLRGAAAETLFARPASTHRFLDAVEKRTIKTSEIDPARINVLKASAPADVKARVQKLFAGAGLSARKDVIEKYQPALKLDGDVARGKALFKQHCAVCHRLEGVGEQIGADLTGLRDKGPDVILLNILDPNREVLPKFLSYVAVTDAGRTVTGIIASEAANSITLRRADGSSETLLRANIEDLRSTGLSYMPEGLEQQLPLQGMADLLAYFQSIR